MFHLPEYLSTNLVPHYRCNSYKPEREIIDILKVKSNNIINID